MKQVVVIGGGVIGLTTAYALIQAGARVTLLEAASSVAQGCSFANGGQLSYRYVSPLADAHVPWKALAWMAAGNRSPLKFAPTLDPAQWKWLWQFLLLCRRRVNARNTTHLLALALKSREVLSAWQTQASLADFSWRNSGKLVLYRKTADLQTASQQLLESSQQVLSSDQCLALDGALKHLAADACGGIFTPGDDVADCHAFCQAVLQRLCEAPTFTLLENCSVNQIRVQAGLAAAVVSSQGDIPCDEVILANGVAVAQLARQWGERLPIYPLKGYSLSVPVGADQAAPSVSVTDLDNKIVYARIGDTLRAAAMVDIVGYDRSVDGRRIAHLQQLTQQAFPQLQLGGDTRAWAGLRPATPSGMPIIGRGRHRNIWYNAGHGALGFTLAAGCAQILSESLLQGRETLECLSFIPA
ncbi:D-amino acid dehydrogenase 2 [Pseudomonas sp. 8AS]|uniref:D-amino acid dehydrogenase n=1 Tax=Pseudomonas sp. 8AS TaxID=2653163 RepID=UPI0012F09CDC|nr:D-amino acid dehydrogenase [Pseudomonas sp. 8AS]VXB62117.1 D-amino acid dehydrogenase 2 [Pseudomonas sp. 8AS]